jgi:hypothetical protein
MLGKQNLRALTVSCCLRDSIYLSWNDVEVCRLATMCNSSIAGVCVPYTIPASMSAPYSRCPHPSRLNLLLIGVPHTPNRTNVNTLVVLLGEHVTRNINAHSSTGLEATLHAGAVAAGCSEAGLTRGTDRCGDVEAIATSRCSAGGCCACEVPEPGSGGWESSRRGADAEKGDDGDFGKHFVR